MSIPVKVTVTVTLERSDPSGRVDVYGNIETFIVSGPACDDDPPDVKTGVVARRIFTRAAQELREASGEGEGQLMPAPDRGTVKAFYEAPLLKRIAELEDELAALREDHKDCWKAWVVVEAMPTGLEDMLSDEDYEDAGVRRHSDDDEDALLDLE
jgi:hypothetical protein